MSQMSFKAGRANQCSGHAGASALAVAPLVGGLPPCPSLERSTLWVFTTLLHCNRGKEVVAQGAILGIPTSWEIEVACSASPTLPQP